MIKMIEEQKIDIPRYKKEIFQLIFNYICFYSIELKSYKVSHKILDKITTVYTDNVFEVFIDNEDKHFELTEESNKNEITNELTEEEKVIKRIQKKYFTWESINFQYFESVAKYIVAGFLNDEILSCDINSSLKILDDVQLKIKKDQIDNIFSLKNNEYVDVINDLIKTAEEGELDLISYVLLFHRLAWLKKYNLKGIDDFETIKERLFIGVEVAFERDGLIYIPQLENQIRYKHIIDEDDEDYNEFRDLIIKTNNKIKEVQVVKETEDLLSILKSQNKDYLYKMVKDKERLSLNSETAQKIFPILKETDSDMINFLLNALSDRYVLRLNSNMRSTTRENEMEFIRELYRLLLDAPFLKENPLEKMSYVQLHSLKNYLAKIIDDENKK